MGLLDDAIREHLELKRKAGADPGEVARLEREALSPPVREPSPAEPVAEPAERFVEPIPAGDDPHSAPTQYHEAAPGGAEPRPPAAPPEEGAPDAGQPTVAYDADELFAADQPPRPTPPPPRREERDPADEIFADEPEPEPEPEEDVLEETPEFLQETPEHDRLWFEQKPPRDFDFDK